MINVILYPPLSKEKRVIGLSFPEGSFLSIRQVIRRLQAKVGDFPAMAGLGTIGNPEEYLMVLLNDRIVNVDAMVQEGDSVKLVMNMSGG